MRVIGYPCLPAGRGLSVIGLIVFLSFSPLACATQSDYQTMENSKQIEDGYTWDFGRIKEGAVYRHEFMLKNESNSVLKIKDVSASCGCTTPKVTKKILEPQESTPIEVEFNSKGYSGPVTQYVYVNTDSLDNPIIRYIIKAHVLMTNVKIQSTK